MGRLFKALWFAGAFSVVSHAAPARAQHDASHRALAVELFDEAEALLKKNQLSEACPKYAESYRLDPQLGVLVFLAECYEKNGQLASAWATFREAEEMARRRGDARARGARERVDAIQPRLSRLTVNVPEASRLRGLSVSRDGLPLTAAAWSVATAVDGGNHVVEVTAPGRKTWRSELAVPAEQGAITVEVPVLEEEATAATAPIVTPPAPVSSPPKAVAAPTPAPHRAAPLPVPDSPLGSSPGSSRRLTALAVGGLGVVGFGVGGFLGVSAQSSFSDSKDLCNDADICTPAGTELRKSAKTKALVATVATSLGAAAFITAAVLWFTAPSSDSTSARRVKSRQASWSVAPTQASWGLELNHAF